ncbi:MAG: hypothetical protein HUK22_07080 [Thermoguttaceae bacterium]|nr:hypothetical protein [Thermoguttaceae bacterium]
MDYRRVSAALAWTAALTIGGLCASLCARADEIDDCIPNLAFLARASADQEAYSTPIYGAIDGWAARNSKESDIWRSWTVDGDKCGGKTWYRLEWEEPQTVGAVVYFGRTSPNHGFREYEIWLDDDSEPVVKGEFQRGNGGQIVEFEPREITSLRIQFLNAWDDIRWWGASEIAVFERRPTEAELDIAVSPAASERASGLTVEKIREAGAPEEIIFVTRKPSSDPHWYANISYYADNSNRYPFPIGSGGGLYAYNLDTGAVRTIIEDPKGNFRDPQVHYDGKKILFSYLPAGKFHYSLYTINSDGTGLRQLTGVGEDAPLNLPKCVVPSDSQEYRASAEPLGDARDFAPPGWDDFEPTWLPDDSIVFCSTRVKRYVQCWQTQVATLHRLYPDGTIRELSCNIEQDNTPWVLNNGQIIYMRWEYVDREQMSYHHLWTMGQDGTRQMVFYGNQSPGTCMLAPKPIPGTNKVVCTFSPGHGIKEHHGSIVVVDPSFGPDAPEGAKTVATQDIYSDPWAFDETLFMAAAKTQIVALNDQGRSKTLYQLPDDLVKAGFWIGEPRPLQPRDREPILSDSTNPNAAEGTIAMLNVYHGRQMGDVPQGAVKYLLVYETLAKPIHYDGGMGAMSSGGTFTIERLLGRVPVAEDGSAYFKVPANRTIFFLAMDENERCIKRMHSFTSVMPGENLSCIGCHENRTETATGDEKNRLLTLMKTPPVEIEPIPDVPQIFDYSRDIQPILDKYCLECHNPNRADGGLNLSGHWTTFFNTSYLQLTARKCFGDNRNRAKSNFAPYEIGTGSSRLVKLIDEKHGGVEMPEAEQRIIRYWIDAGANYAGTYAADACGGFGYAMNNTITSNDAKWPETAAFSETMAKRCDECHAVKDANISLPHRFSGDGRFSRFNVFDLSYPEESRLLRAPLSKSAGGFGICEAKSGRAVFESTDDPDYQAMLDYVKFGRRYILEVDNRPEMLNASPNNGVDCPQKFTPRWAYLREMIRYGILPIDADPTASYNVYELEEKYWRSLHYDPNEVKKGNK